MISMGRTMRFANAPGFVPGVQRLLRYSKVAQKPLNPRHKAGGGASEHCESGLLMMGRAQSILMHANARRMALFSVTHSLFVVLHSECSSP